MDATGLVLALVASPWHGELVDHRKRLVSRVVDCPPGANSAPHRHAHGT